MDIVRLRPGDQWALIELTRAMHAESPVYSPYPYEATKLVEWGKLCINDPNWLCLIAWEGRRPVGFVAVGSVEMLFSTTRTVDDLGLYVVPDRRGSSIAARLVDAMETWARGKGRAIRLGVTTGVHRDRTVGFLEKLGYAVTGTLLTKTL